MAKVNLKCRICGETVRVPAEQVAELDGCCPLHFREEHPEQIVRRKSKDDPKGSRGKGTGLGIFLSLFIVLLILDGALTFICGVMALVVFDAPMGPVVFVAAMIHVIIQLGLAAAFNMLIVLDRRTQTILGAVEDQGKHLTERADYTADLLHKLAIRLIRRNPTSP